MKTYKKKLWNSIGYVPMHGGVFDPEVKEKRILELQEQTADGSIWQDREQAAQVIQELNDLTDLLEPWRDLKHEIEDILGFIELALEEPDGQTYAGELAERLEDAKNRFHSLKASSVMSGKFDKNPAFLTIHSGAGGTEACDWVQMLYRMYLRWADAHAFSYQTLDILEAEGGIKSVTVEITGKHAYGYLKGETGIHRLVRISPFDSNKRRHTSFASVHVSPVIEDEIEFEITSEDIRVDTYRASGAGGQHVNTTDSAVRITHLETGIVVQCQNERSQHKNRAVAMKMLTSRLYAYYEQKREEEHAKHAAEKKGISWGNQIRSYVFHPYSMVKDHRTLEQSGNVQAVMDGDIDRFIEAYLTWKWEQEL